jgi:mono/diheme cytochrome c family protein
MTVTAMGTLRLLLVATLVSIFAGCGTENPFARGPEALVDGDGPGGGKVRFAADVVPILRACASCHSGGAGGWTYTGGAGAYAAAVSIVDTENPEESLLLVMATGGGGHGGGTIFAAGSSAYATVRAWIEQGARGE